MSRPALDLHRHASGLGKKKSLSFVWICEEAESDVETTLPRYLDVIQREYPGEELIIVNNGLGSQVDEHIAKTLAARSIAATVLSLHLPGTESAALSAAFRRVNGEIIVLLPSYLQADPGGIGEMVAAVGEGVDYVASRRIARVDGPAHQRKSRVFNLITRWLSGISVHDINSGLRVMRREVLEEVPLYGDLHIYLPILAARRGFRIGEVCVRHVQERPSKSAHGLGGYLRRGLDLFTLFFLLRFTERPFRFFGGIGATLLAVGGAVNLVLALQRIVMRQALADRPMLILATLLMVLGIQMFSLGLIGELIIFVNASDSSNYAGEKVFEVVPSESNRTVA